MNIFFKKVLLVALMALGTGVGLGFSNNANAVLARCSVVTPCSCSYEYSNGIFGWTETYVCRSVYTGEVYHQ